MEKEKQLAEALRETRNMLINVCPSDLAGDKELVDVIQKAEEALKSTVPQDSIMWDYDKIIHIFDQINELIEYKNSKEIEVTNKIRKEIDICIFPSQILFSRVLRTKEFEKVHPDVEEVLLHITLKLKKLFSIYAKT